MLILALCCSSLQARRLLRERGRGDPAGAKSAEEAPRHARGKRSVWNGIQQTSLTQPFI